MIDHRRMSKSELGERLNALQLPSRDEGTPGARQNELELVLHELEVHRVELEMQNRELRESRQELEESHNRYVNLYDFAPIGYVTLSEQGEIREINLTAAEMLGIERHWLINRSFAPWVTGADLPLLRAHLKECREDGRKVTTTLRLLRRDKQSIPVEVSTLCVADRASGCTLFRTAITDLTERRRAEADLDSFFRLSADLMCIVGADGRFERVNPACEQALGYSAEELLGRSFFELVIPNDRSADAVDFHRLKHDGVSTTHFQNRILCKNGSFVWLSWSTITFANTLYCVARDVSAQVRAKEVLENQHRWLSAVVRKMPVPLYLVETQTGNVVSASAVAETLLKDFPKSQAEIPSSSAFFADERRDRLPLERWPRARAAAGEELNNSPYLWRTPTEVAHLLVSSKNIAPEYDQPAMAIIVTQDVTHLKRIEESLQETVETLEAERDLRERFVSALSHDLRTPLTGAKIKTQLMTRKADQPDFIKTCTAEVVGCIDRVDRMIQDLLDANRIRAGENVPLALTEFDLTGLVKDTIKELRSLYGDRFALREAGPVIGRWSAQGIRRMIENLAGNAIKYGAKDHPVTLSVFAGAGREAILSVHNVGNPIPAAEQPTLFQQFRRAAAAESGKQLGWGIGLTLVKGTVDAHGGGITVESGVEVGTTFRVLLPLGDAASKI